MTTGVRRAAFVALALVLGLPAPGAAQSLNDVYRRVSTSVVVIRARGSELTADGEVRFREIGSGVLITPDGKVATAAHVVLGLEDITVEFLGEEPVPARVIAVEQWADVALVQVAVVPRGATVSELADSDPVLIGDPVFIVGAPYGLSYALSQGVISARWAPNTVTKDFPLAEFFQTDTTLNTGNSGGPMFTRKGELIGIVSHNISKSGGSEGLGFVVTSNSFRNMLMDRRGFFGLDLVLVTGTMAQALKVPQAGGFLVKRVAKDSVAERMGLKGGNRVGIVDGQQMVVGGDVLLSVQGIPILGLEDRAKVLKALAPLRPGDDLRVTILRDGQVRELSMKFTGF